MVKKNRINLVEEFKKSQKKNDFIILTTFTFDPMFFDNFLYKEILSNNPRSEIIVLVDSVQYEKNYDNFTQITGNKYHLIPILMEKGVFHPKLFLFISKEKISYYLGSGNLSLQGFTKNAELISKTEYQFNECLADIEEIIKIIKKLNSKFIQGNLSETFDYIADEYLPVDCKENNEFIIIHNLNEPILYQLIDQLKMFEFDEIDILAPFFSKNPLIISELIKNLKIKKINILLQDHNHNLSNPQKYQDIAKENGIKLEFKKVTFEDKNRIFHSKIIFFKGQNNFLLVGSPNFTISALIKDSETGNIEFSILYQKIIPDEIFKAINIEPINDIEEIIPIDNPENVNVRQVQIFAVDYDEITRELHVILAPIKKEVNISILLGDGNSFDLIKTLNDSEFDIHIPYSYPKEIKIEINGIITKRRVFYDEKRIFKGGSYSYKDLDERLFNDPIVEMNDILAIIGGFGYQKPRKSDPTDIKHHTKRNKRVLPGSISKNDTISIIKDLNRIDRFIEYRSRLEKEEDLLDESQLKTETKTSYNLTNKKAESILINIIQSGNKILLSTTERLDEENEENWRIRSHSLFINLFVPLIIKLIETEPAINKLKIFEEIKRLLEEDIKFIDADNCFKDVLSHFFSRLLLLDYYFYDSFIEQETYNFLDIFDYKDLLNEKTFLETQEHVKKITNYLNLSFRNDIFNENYVNLMEYVFDSSTIEPGLKYSIEQVTNEEKDYQSVMKQLITKMIGNDEEQSRFTFNEDNEIYIKAKNILN